MKKKLFVGMMASILLTVSVAWAQVARTVNFQGKLTQSDGTPVEGLVTMVFSIYQTDTGGSPVWTEPQSVLVENGIYNVSLGAETTGGLDLDFDLVDYWLGVTVDGEEMTTRQLLTSVPMAINADTIDGIHADELGDITGVTAGTGLIGGGTGGDVQLDVDTDYMQRRVVNACPQGSSIRQIGPQGGINCETDDVGITEETDPTVNALARAELACNNGQVAKWNGAAWVCANEPDPRVGANTTNYVPKWNGSALVTGLLYDGGSSMGIGTSTPGAPLHIRTGGDVASIFESTDSTAAVEITDPNGTVALRTSAGHMIFGLGGYELAYEKARITPDGNVGIGTPTPHSLLHMKGDGWDTLIVENNENDPSLQLTSDGSSVNNDWTIRMDVSGNSDVKVDDADDSLQYRYDGVTKMIMTTAGDVGIGTTSPAEKLTVAGTIESTSGGIKFPDGTVQTTAAAPSWHQILPAAERFELVMNDEAVLDKETGLVWQRTTLGINNTLSNVVEICENIDTGGRKGWHLPTIEQLASLVDSTQVNPALPSGHPFILYGSAPYRYWSATASGSSARIVDFDDGDIKGSVQCQPLPWEGPYCSIWCVRGGQARDVY